jgi:hypothetical protein
MVVAVTLGGCGKDETGSAQLSNSDPSLSGGETISSTWPLTGLPVTGDDQAAQRHPVLVTKIDNTTSASPQVGLGSADMVVEELVEGGLTRLAVFHYSQLPTVAGPVRSMRASDIGIVSPVDATVITSGAAARTISRISAAGITFFQEGADGIYRDGTRPAPYNVFANLRTVAKDAAGPAARPRDYLTWGSVDDRMKGARAKTVNAIFSGGHTTSWVYRQGHYVNTNTNAAQDDQFPADTVLVLRVPVGDAGYLDPAGNPVPETRLEGEGAALLFHGGKVLRATWAKAGLDAPITLSTKAGDLAVPPGHTWLELVPARGGDPRFSNGNVTFK